MLIISQILNEIKDDDNFPEVCSCSVGKHNEEDEDQYDEDELAMGIEIEKEHTDDPEIAIQIAKDHLSEIPDYYTRLKKMEKSADQNTNKKD